jgi:catechol 2,3-dioxygenase-like lactoylglutathione lyase family enzyme
MPGEEFRFAYHTPSYRETFEFYAEGLGLELIESWDRDVDDQGALFRAASGIIEILSLPSGEPHAAPGGSVLIEVDDVDGWHARLSERGLAIEQPPTDRPWGHRDLALEDPNGLRVVLFSASEVE